MTHDILCRVGTFASLSRNSSAVYPPYQKVPHMDSCEFVRLFLGSLQAPHSFRIISTIRPCCSLDALASVLSKGRACIVIPYLIVTAIVSLFLSQ